MRLKATVLIVGLLAACPVWGQGDLYECPGDRYSDRMEPGCKKLRLQENSVSGAEFYGVPDRGSDPVPVRRAEEAKADPSYDSPEECSLYREYLDLMQQGGSVGNGISPDKFMRRATLSRMFGPSLYGGGRHPHCP